MTGSAPTPVDNCAAGLSHEWKLETKYYKATIPIWVDEVQDVETWRTEFLKDEAREVVSVVGAWIYCFRRPIEESDVDELKSALKAISDVVERGGGYGWEGVRLAVAMPQSTTPYLEKSFDEWDALCGEFGFEYADFEAKGRNEYGGKAPPEPLPGKPQTDFWQSP